MATIVQDILNCDLCAGRFAGTATGHKPRPVPWFRSTARILIAGQAPGARVHESGRPFTDPSGDKLRAWLGLDAAAFYDKSRVAIVPMAFCFPGYDAKGSDLPPPKLCAETWRQRVLEHLPKIDLTILIGGPAQDWHLQSKGRVLDRVANWRELAPAIYPLLHPSWRNNALVRRHPWYENELLPALRNSVQQVLNDT